MLIIGWNDYSYYFTILGLSGLVPSCGPTNCPPTFRC